MAIRCRDLQTPADAQTFAKSLPNLLARFQGGGGDFRVWQKANISPDTHHRRPACPARTSYDK